uniref:Uncharacterized protein n=1 Tax=Molossus molossus TaxID=27622 RepID=A0A7J8F9F0_MOLMO|nr:hypothetical protein HJG59_008588 [Molossus molossus]
MNSKFSRFALYPPGTVLCHFLLTCKIRKTLIKHLSPGQFCSVVRALACRLDRESRVQLPLGTRTLVAVCPRPSWGLEGGNQSVDVSLLHQCFSLFLSAFLPFSPSLLPALSKDKCKNVFG